MEQKKLRDLERRCIQEEAPQCVAACPIHVDARAFLAKAALGAWDEAVRVLAAAMPLPGIVARICDHPCQRECLRAESGGAIAIADLERAAIRRGKRGKAPVLLPAKGERVACVGGTLSSLVAAWDLARKGYEVTILAQGERLGGALREFPEGILPHAAIEEEVRLMREMGVRTRPIPKPGEPSLIEAVRAEFDAVYVASDEEDGVIEALGLGHLSIDPLTLSTSLAGLFIGRKGTEGDVFSPIEAVARGRKAATSMDRHLQKVSLTAEREREGPYKTRLITNLEGVASRPVVPMGDRTSGYSDAEAMEEASRCIGCECMECVKACLFLERFKS